MIRVGVPGEAMWVLAFIAVWNLFLIAGAGAEEHPREIAWQDLIAPVAAEIDDPFAELSGEQLMRLAQVARIRQLIESKRIPADSPSAEDEKRFVAELGKQGIDVDWLLSQRERVTRERKMRAEQVDQQFVEVPIRIPGYTLPLATNSDGMVTELLLVPWLGACIHTPPPLPNQMIHVTVPDGTDYRGRFSAVWLEGTLEHKPARHRLFLVDGTRELQVTYSMTTRGIRDYSPDESDVLARVEIPDEVLKGHGWLQTLQAKFSMIFTQAMGGLRDGGTSKAFWFAIGVGLAYGFLHTLGPGHGKAVVISYFVGDGGSFRKGITMGVLIAVFHVLSSIIVVLVADFAVRQATGQAPSDYRAIRLGSYALIIVIGAVMLHRAVRASKVGHSREDAGEHSDDGHDHGHHHHGCLACAALEKKKGAGNWLALAVGVVPCTGALLVLLFGVANDLLFVAILMVAAISAGMAVAMSGIGILAIAGRRAAFRGIKDDDVRRARFTSGLRVAGAAVVLLIGSVLFSLTWSNSGQLSLPAKPLEFDSNRAQGAEQSRDPPRSEGRR